MRVPDTFRECVVFIGIWTPKLDGTAELSPRGTGFFVGTPNEANSALTTIYLVTARHVVERLKGTNAALRMNTSDGSSKLVTIPPTTPWLYHDDPNVDMAMLPWAPQDPFRYKHIGAPMFLTDVTAAAGNIGPGDEVFIVGLFAHLAGTQRNLPIVRMGNLAMIPGEAVPSAIGPIEAYLIEARSIGGLSGSPAFVREGRLGEKIHFLGLMHGHWDTPATSKNDDLTADEWDTLGRVNLGIAIVVPAKKNLGGNDVPKRSRATGSVGSGIGAKEPAETRLCRRGHVYAAGHGGCASEGQPEAGTF
jgi:hypothetical protein